MNIVYRIGIAGMIFSEILMLAGCGNHKSFFEACNGGDAAKVETLIKGDPSLIKITNEYNDTGLNLAVERGDLKTIETLLKAGSDPDHQSYRLGTPLQYVAYYGNIQTADLLLKAGAKINYSGKDASNNSPPLYGAAVKGSVEMVTFLLQKGANSNELSRDGMASPLSGVANSQVASDDERLHVIQLLVDAGADVNAKNSYGKTPLDYAVSRGIKEEVIDYLKSKGAIRGRLNE